MTRATSPTAKKTPDFEVLTKPLKVLGAADVGLERITIAAGQDIQVAPALAYENVSEFNMPLATHLVNDIYVARAVAMQPIDLIRLPPAKAYAAEEFLVAVDDCWLEEHIPPWMPPGSPAPPSVRSSAQAGDILGEVVVLARFGATTWGHWLGELIPKVALLEAAYPGRFSYTVPEVLEREQFSSFRQALLFHGVSPERLVFLRHGRDYRLAKPWLLSTAWSEFLLHPAAAAAMRARVPVTHAPMARRVALLRRPGDGRDIENWKEVGEALRDRGYDHVHIADLTFEAQVRVFTESRSVVSVLGSGLTGLIYSPQAVRVASFAPSHFGDRFFYGLICGRQGRYADVRGYAPAPTNGGTDRSPFELSVARLHDALDALDAPE
jgi:hypothetical protein